MPPEFAQVFAPRTPWTGDWLVATILRLCAQGLDDYVKHIGRYGKRSRRVGASDVQPHDLSGQIDHRTTALLRAQTEIVRKDRRKGFPGQLRGLECQFSPPRFTEWTLGIRTVESTVPRRIPTLTQSPTNEPGTHTV